MEIYLVEKLQVMKKIYNNNFNLLKNYCILLLLILQLLELFDINIF